LKDDDSLYRFLTLRKFKKATTLTCPSHEILSEHNLQDVSQAIRDPISGFDVRKWRGKTCYFCFIANEAVTWLVEQFKLRNRAEGVVWGEFLQKNGGRCSARKFAGKGENCNPKETFRMNVK